MEPINRNDPEVAKLLEEVRSLLASNQELAAKVEEAMKKIDLTGQGDRITIGKQVNISQSGMNNKQTNKISL